MGQAYLSCNLAWRFLVYRKSSPEGFEENIFSLCSLVELFNLIFVRSVQSASLYPKVVTASLVAGQSKTSSFELFCGLSTCALCPKSVFAGFMTVFDFDIYLVVICFTDSGDATGLPPFLHFLLFVPISQPGIHCLLLLVLLRDGLLFEPLWGASFSIQQFKWSKWTTQFKATTISTEMALVPGAGLTSWSLQPQHTYKCTSAGTPTEWLRMKDSNVFEI